MRRLLLENEQKLDVFVWEEIGLAPFDELIVSWNAQRPAEGAYLIQVSVLMGEWSPWMDYAFWGVTEQYTYEQYLSSPAIQVYQDSLEILENRKANGFRVRVIAKGKATLNHFRTLYSSMIDHSVYVLNSEAADDVSINLGIGGLSQLALTDERSKRLCSPTSTTAIIRFLLNSTDLSPLAFADTIHDSAFDIYGNWVLNVAQASHELGSLWNCYVVRLKNFNQIIDQLKKGHPVVVSVKGQLKNSALSYESGHLLVVKGYDSTLRQVICMDPAYASDELTHVKYDLSDFLEAWNRRKGLAYLFNDSCL